MGSAWNIERIADSFSRAATSPAEWPIALDVLSCETGARGAVMIPHRARSPFVPGSESLAGPTEYYFRHGWHARDLRDRALPRMNQHGVAVDLDVTTEDAMRREPYYQEFLAPFRLKWFAGVRLRVGEDLWTLSIQRGPEEGPFSPEEQTRLIAVGDRLSGAATLACAIGWARLEGLADGLDHAGLAALLIDASGAVIRTNAAAERSLGSDLNITGKAKRLSAADPQLRAPIDRMIGAALGLCGPVTLPLPVAVPRLTGRGFILHAVPLAGDAALLLAPARAVILVRDLDGVSLPLEAHLRAVFGLSAAEARLAVAISTGEGINTAADRLGIAAHTARNQLAAVFAKTGTSRQAELVRVLLQFGSCA